MDNFQKALALLIKNPLLRKQIYQRLTTPDKIIQVFFPVKINGQEKIFKGYRVQFNRFLGPYKGGLRFHPQVSIPEVKMLAFLMMIKCALASLPFGGGKGGVVVQPKNLSKNQLKELSQNYIRSIIDFLGPYKDIPAPDVNTNSQIIDWMSQEFRLQNSKLKLKYQNNEVLGAFTGKSISNGGIQGRTEATGLGGYFVLEETIKTFKIKPRKKEFSVAIQGFGNVGYHLADFLYQNGFKIVALADSHGAIFVEEGLNPSLTLKCKKEKGSLAGCYCVGSVCDLKKGKLISNKDFFSLPVDILVPAALENAINSQNVKDIKAKIILEMANSGISSPCYPLLAQKGITVIPDVLANSGGVIVSYFEWKQNLSKHKYELKKVYRDLESKIKKAANQVFLHTQKYKTDLKTAAYLVAIKKLIEKNPKI